MLVPEMAKLNLKERKAVLFPELAPKMASDVLGTVDENTVSGASDALWQSVARKSITLGNVTLAPLDTFSTNLDNLDLEQPEEDVHPTVNVLVIEDVGDAVDNMTDWRKSATKKKYHKVECDRVSRSFSVSGYDLARGENLAQLVDKAVNKVALRCIQKVMAAIALSDSPFVQGITGGALTQEDIPTLAGVFGDKGRPDALILKPEYYVKVLPKNGLSLPMDKLAIKNIYETAGLDEIEAGCAGLLTRKEGIVVGGGTPKIYDAFKTIGVRSLGKIGGLEMLLKFWEEPGVEQIWCSVETMIGARVVDASCVKIMGS